MNPGDYRSSVRRSTAEHKPCAPLRAGLIASLCALAVVSMASGCSRRGGDIAYAPPGFVAPTVETTGELAQDTPLGPLDTIKVTVFRVPDLSGEFQISSDGFLEMPLIERYSVRNQTASQVAHALQLQYGQRYLNNPSITIRVVNSHQHDVTIEGGVLRPGVFPIPGSTTLISAIALGGGIDPDRGNARRVAIFRKVDGKTFAAAFDVADIRNGKMANPIVYPGDTIVVAGDGVRAVFRDVLQALPVVSVFKAL